MIRSTLSLISVMAIGATVLLASTAEAKTVNDPVRYTLGLLNEQVTSATKANISNCQMVPISVVNLRVECSINEKLDTGMYDYLIRQCETVFTRSSDRQGKPLFVVNSEKCEAITCNAESGACEP